MSGGADLQHLQSAGSPVETGERAYPGFAGARLDGVPSVRPMFGSMRADTDHLVHLPGVHLQRIVRSHLAYNWGSKVRSILNHEACLLSCGFVPKQLLGQWWPFAHATALQPGAGTRHTRPAPPSWRETCDGSEIGPWSGAVLIVIPEQEREYPSPSEGVSGAPEPALLRIDASSSVLRSSSSAVFIRRTKR